jgi:hypothetical protein
VYESTDNGRTLTVLNGSPVDNGLAGSPKYQPNPTADIGTVNALVYGGRAPDALGVIQNHAEIIFVGTNGNCSRAANQHPLWVRQAVSVIGTTPLTAVTCFTTAAGGPA